MLLWQLNLGSPPVSARVSWVQFDTGSAPAHVRVTWVQFDTEAMLVASGGLFPWLRRRRR